MGTPVSAVSNQHNRYAELQELRQKQLEGKDLSANKETVEMATGKNDIAIFTDKKVSQFKETNLFNKDFQGVKVGVAAQGLAANNDSIWNKEQKSGVTNNIFNFGSEIKKTFTKLNPSEGGANSSDKKDKGGNQGFAQKTSGSTLEKERYDKMNKGQGFAIMA